LIFKNHNGAAYYQFEQLAGFREINHGVFLRTPGFSKAPFNQLNTSFSVGDDASRVESNRNLVAQCLEAPELVFARQVHSRRVLVIDERPRRNRPPEHAALLEGDAMVTNQPGRYLVVQVADCQPILMYNPRCRVVACVHAGWRGSVANIIGRTLKAMGLRFGCLAKDTYAGVGPSLGPCCAEFINYRQEIPQSLWNYRCDSTHFDFWAMSRDQLVAGGVPENQIQLSGCCTKCNTERFFSYRGEKTTGRFPAVIGLAAA
jgi:YfiH family protein